MKSNLFALALGVLLVFGWSGQVQAQEEHYGTRPFELNFHAGAIMVDAGGESDNDTDVLFGTRAVWNAPSGWGFGASFDYVLSDADVDDDTEGLSLAVDGEDIDTSTWLYGAGIEYTFPSQSQAHFFVGAGIGAATTKLSDAPEGVEDSSTDLMVPVGGGLKWFNRTNDPSWALRADVRDNIIFRETFDADEEDSTGSEATNNFELSGGLSFLFGGN
ncbi:MAG: outer membrane beta-barrel protein [Gemmatimonadota bacterium]